MNALVDTPVALEAATVSSSAKAPRGPAGSWLRQAGRLTVIETATYLRDRTAIFWTFIYPIVLLVVLMAIFGGGASRFQSIVDVEGRGPAAERYIELLESRFAAIEGSDFTLRRVDGATASPEGRVRVVLPQSFGTSEQPGAPIVVRLDGSPDAESGAMLSVVAETATALNARLAATPEIVPVRYDIAPSEGDQQSASAIYYVVGIGVLTMISTALFGFSGPLIELRARGGFKRFQFMPIHKTAFLTGFAMCRVLILVAFVLTFLLAGLAIYASLSAVTAANWGMIAMLILLGTISFLAAGMALAGLVSSNTLASAVINFINLPIMFLSDLFIPISIMPEIVQDIAHYSPVYLLVDAMRQASMGTLTLMDCVPVLISLGATFAVALAVILTTFRWRLAR